MAKDFVFLRTLLLVEAERMGLKKIDFDKFAEFLHQKLIDSGKASEIQSDYFKRQKFIKNCIRLYNNQ